MRTIRKIHKAVYSPIDDLITYRAMPTASIQHIDPFLFLNHHGPQEYPVNNNGLPFGPHPHRGFETLTLIYKGDIMHMDSGGNKSIINEGGIQWMTAGRGVIHSEISSDEFKEKGGELEIIQLWLNLPARLKMTEPNYIGLQKEKIPEILLEEGKMRINIIAGEYKGMKAAINSLTSIHIYDIRLLTGARYTLHTQTSSNILFYLVSGELEVNGRQVSRCELIEFGSDHEEIDVLARSNSILLFGYGNPYNEPIVAQGPFVMNNYAEIKQAYIDYSSGKMGKWEYS